MTGTVPVARPGITHREDDIVPELVSYRLNGRIATIAMDDGKANALSLQMLSAVNAALDRATADDAVVVLTGRPGIFSGGFDLKVLTAGGPDATRMLEQGFLLALRLLEHPTPVVIACNGHAVAMGSFLLLSGDYRIGVDGPFRLVANEVAIGLTMPWAAIEICRQRLAPAHFNRAVILAESYGPAEGVTAGFLDRVVDQPGLDQTAAAVATAFDALDRSAHAATKSPRAQAVAAIRRGLEADQAHSGDSVPWAPPTDSRWSRLPAEVLLAMVGVGLVIGNRGLLVIRTVAVACDIVYRITIEERALSNDLGGRYQSYARSRRGLVPFMR